MPVPDPIGFAQTKFSITLRHATGDEWVGPCPNCHQGDDRFHVWKEKGNFWCRQCGYSGFLDDLDGAKQMTTEERVEWRLQQLERKQQEQEERLNALEQMHRCKDHLRYHFDMPMDKMEYWLDEGMTGDTIAKYQLGYCPRCPTDRDGRPSYTIPVIIHGKLYNIRHRLIGGDQNDKYRPHRAGLPNVLFNADDIYRDDTDEMIVCEGEKKSIILAQEGFANVGIMGKAGFNKAWTARFERFKRVYVALDPDAVDVAERTAELFGARGRVVDLPVKVDDMLVRYNASADDIKWYLSLARPANGTNGD